MPNDHIDLNKSDVLKGEVDHQANTVMEKLSLEASLLGGGLKDGFVARSKQAFENPGWTALEFGGAAAIGAGLTTMSRAGGRWGAAADVSAKVLMGVAGIDLLCRTTTAAEAMRDTWTNPQNYDANRGVVASHLGSAIFDYPVMMAGGMAGSYGAYQLHGRFGSNPISSLRTVGDVTPGRTVADIGGKNPIGLGTFDGKLPGAFDGIKLPGATAGKGFPGAFDINAAIKSPAFETINMSKLVFQPMIVTKTVFVPSPSTIFPVPRGESEHKLIKAERPVINEAPREELPQLKAINFTPEMFKEIQERVGKEQKNAAFIEIYHSPIEKKK